MDDYKTLGISPGASFNEAHQAWRMLVRKHHPDHALDPSEASRRLSEINAAFGRLKEHLPRGSDAAADQNGSHQASPPSADYKFFTEQDVKSFFGYANRILKERQEARQRAQAAHDLGAYLRDAGPAVDRLV